MGEIWTVCEILLCSTTLQDTPAIESNEPPYTSDTCMLTRNLQSLSLS